jgi:hypothetical protein
MGIFRRRAQPAQGHPIFEFWSWWNAEGAEALAAAIATGEYGSLPSVVATKAAAINPNLAWELGKGANSEHRFSLTSGGIAELRPIVERWIRAAPPASATWEFASSLLRSPDDLDGTVEFDGHPVALDEVRFAVRTDEERHRVDVVAFHPQFAVMAEREQLGLTYLMLDWCLGEDDVERWVGSIDVTTESLASGIRSRELADLVDALAARREDDAWSLISWTTDDGEPAMAVARQWTRWIDHPVLDQHNAITVSFAERTEQGFPGPSSLERLRALEDELTAHFGIHGLLVAHETLGGRRTLHFYTDSNDQNVSDGIAQWATASGCLTLEQRADPSWQNVRQFTG